MHKIRKEIWKFTRIVVDIIFGIQIYLNSRKPTNIPLIFWKYFFQQPISIQSNSILAFTKAKLDEMDSEWNFTFQNQKIWQAWYPFMN